MAPTEVDEIDLTTIEVANDEAVRCAKEMAQARMYVHPEAILALIKRIELYTPVK